MENKINQTYPLRHLIYLMIQEVIIAIKMLVPELSLANQFIRYLSFQIHHLFQHVVVGLARKHDFTRVQLAKGGCYRP